MLIKKLDYPKVPVNLIDAELKKIKHILDDPESASEHSWGYVTELDVEASIKAFKLDKDSVLVKWLNENIGDHYWSIHIIWGGNTLPPHIDPGRTYGFNYVIEPGGANVITKSYEPREKNIKDLGLGVPISYNDIICVQEELCSKNKWYSLRVDQVHSVEGLESMRIILNYSSPEDEQELKTIWNARQDI